MKTYILSVDGLYIYIYLFINCHLICFVILLDQTNFSHATTFWKHNIISLDTTSTFNTSAIITKSLPEDYCSYKEIVCEGLPKLGEKNKEFKL